MLKNVELGSCILQRLEQKLEQDIIRLEYGVPSSKEAYTLIRTFTAAVGKDIPNEVLEAVDMVENEAREGRPGAFFLRIMHPDKDDTIEVWRRNTSN